MQQFTAILIACAFILAASACSEDIQQQDEDAGVIIGPDIVDARDISDTSTADVEDTSRDSAGGRDISDTADDISPQCTPGASWCESPTNRAECIVVNQQAQKRTYTCSPGQVCQNGECVDGEPCDPGATLGCASDAELLVCNEIGNDRVVQRCPSEKPLCVDAECSRVCEPQAVLGCADAHTLSLCNAIGNDILHETCPPEMPECAQGACVPKICSPGETRCGGDQILKCNARGIAEVVIEECAESCSDASCQFPDYTNCSLTNGCEFYAVELPNDPQKCWMDEDCQHLSPRCPYSNCPDATCENRNCRFPIREEISLGIAVTNPATQDPLSVTITDSTGGVIQATVLAGGAELIPVPAQVVNDSVLSERSFHIETDGPANVFQLNPMRQMLFSETPMPSADASTLIPVHALGTRYILPSWSDAGRPEHALLTVVATQNATHVSITPTAALAGGTNVPAVAAGTTANRTLNQGEVLQYKLDIHSTPPIDLTGTEIQSDKAVAVFSSIEVTKIPSWAGFFEHIEAQVPPIDHWGTRYILAKFHTKTAPGVVHEPDIYRVVASQDGTVISTWPDIAGANGAVLDRGEFVEFEYRQDVELSANHPILLAQFMVGAGHGQRLGPGLGDPLMHIPTPNDRFRAYYTFFIPIDYAKNYISVRAPADTTLFLDDVRISAAPELIAGTPWGVWRIPVTRGAHRIRGSRPFGLDIYGYDEAISYGYSGGADYR